MSARCGEKQAACALAHTALRFSVKPRIEVWEFLEPWWSEWPPCRRGAEAAGRAQWSSKTHRRQTGMQNAFTQDICLCLSTMRSNESGNLVRTCRASLNAAFFGLLGLLLGCGFIFDRSTPPCCIFFRLRRSILFCVLAGAASVKEHGSIGGPTNSQGSGRTGSRPSDGPTGPQVRSHGPGPTGPRARAHGPTGRRREDHDHPIRRRLPLQRLKSGGAPPDPGASLSRGIATSPQRIKAPSALSAAKAPPLAKSRATYTASFDPFAAWVVFL